MPSDARVDFFFMPTYIGSVKVMIDETELDRDRTAAAIKSLQEKSLIRQDRRTMPLSPKMDNAEYYTIRDKRTYIDSIIS